MNKKETLYNLGHIIELMNNDIFHIGNFEDMPLYNEEKMYEALKTAIIFIEGFQKDLPDDEVILAKDVLPPKNMRKEFTGPVIKKSEYITCRLCGYSSKDERAFNYANKDIICHHCN